MGVQWVGTVRSRAERRRGLFALLAPPVTLAAIMGLIAGLRRSGVALIAGAFKLRSLINL